MPKIKVLITGSLLSVGIFMFMICLACAATVKMGIGHWQFLFNFVLAAEIIGIFAGSFAAATMAKGRGVICGLFVSTIFIIVFTTAALITQHIDITLAIRGTAMLVSGLIGGILGANRKEKLY